MHSVFREAAVHKCKSKLNSAFSTMLGWNGDCHFYVLQGSGICASTVLYGMVFKKETEGDVTSVKDAKIAVYSCPFDGMITETKVC